MKEEIETVIDRLLDYVHRSGKVTLNEAASVVGRPASQVERLSLLLEEKGLLEVHYDITGVKIAAPKPEENDERQEKEGGAGGDSVVLEEARELEREVLTSENLLKFFENDLQRRVIRAEKMLELLEKSDFTKQELDETTKEIELAIRQLEAFEKEIMALMQKGDSFRQKLLAFRQKLAKVRPISEKRAAPAAALKERIVKIIAELLAFMEFVKQDLKKLVPKPGAKTPLPKIAPAAPAKAGGERKEYPPIAAEAQKPRVEKAHKVALIRGGKPVLTTPAGNRPLVTLPFVQQEQARQPGRKEGFGESGQAGKRTESQLARAVVSLEKMAEVFTGGPPKPPARKGADKKTKAAKNAVRAAAGLEKTSGKKRKKRRGARKTRRKHSMPAGGKRGDATRGKKMRVVRVRKDGRRQHYWVLKKK